MSQLAVENEVEPTTSVATFSPNRDRFVLVLKKGNILKNTVTYSLLLFQTDEAVHAPPPKLLVSFASSSNRPGMQAIKWVDNQTLAFLGENPKQQQELYTINCETRTLKQLTAFPTSLGSFAISQSGNEVLFTAEDKSQSLFDGSAKEDGLIVTNQALSDLIAGQDKWSSGRQQHLFLKRRGSGTATLVNTKGVIVWSDLSLSPDGRYLALQTMVPEVPEGWTRYEDPALQARVRTKYIGKSPSYVYQYELVDVNLGTSRVLVDAPLGGSSEVVWSPDSRSMVVSNTFLPLDVQDATEQRKRESHKFVAEIKIPSGEVVPVTSLPVKLMGWGAANELLLGPAGDFQSDTAEKDQLAFRKTAQGWTSVPPPGTSGQSARTRMQITVREDMNTPPSVFAEDRGTGKRALLLDLNPQLKAVKLGHVEDVEFEAPNGHILKGGLYLPPEYRIGQKYPLVIQTHGWNRNLFWPDGPYPTAFAAQLLAARNIVVVQLDEDSKEVSTPSEPEDAMASYQAAIDYLDGRGLIDRNRVGIIGFSRTGMYVEYTLTHSKYPFQAAVLADISDAGYFRYVALLNFPVFAADLEGLNDGTPFGAGLDAWLKNSPGFNLDKVTAPVWIQANSPTSLFFGWEWFTGLLRLGKPVELLYMPEADHVLVKPRDRMSSQQHTVDWFDFWLNGHEDPGSGKDTEYRRWREMRQHRSSGGKGSITATAP